MREASPGIVGAFAASRPYLSIGVLAAAVVAMAAAGVRHGAPGAGTMLAGFTAQAVYLLALPMILAALAPRKLLPRLLFVAGVLALAVGAAAIDLGAFALPARLAPPFALTAAAFAFFAYLVALSPLSFNVARLGLVAPFAAALGAAGGAGYLAMDGDLSSPLGAAAAALALALGLGAGVNVAADFAGFFAAGENAKRAAAAAGHAAVAPSAFSLAAVASFVLIASMKSNFGAADWALIGGAVTIAAISMTFALVAVTGGLALSPVTEQVAVDENRRRQWFAEQWRPVRLILPPATATAGTAIAGVVVVLGMFEAGVAEPLALAMFAGLIWASAALAFVSLRTSVLIAGLLVASAVIGEYAIAVFGAPLAAGPERLAALTLTAAALGAMTVSWRDAGDVWRNAREIVENALNDGLRRFLFVIGAGVVSLFVAARALAWEGGIAAIIYLLATSFIAVVLAPAAMTAMSARFRL